MLHIVYPWARMKKPPPFWLRDELLLSRLVAELGAQQARVRYHLAEEFLPHPLQTYIEQKALAATRRLGLSGKQAQRRAFELIIQILRIVVGDEFLAYRHTKNEEEKKIGSVSLYVLVGWGAAVIWSDFPKEIALKLALLISQLAASLTLLLTQLLYESKAEVRAPPPIKLIVPVKIQINAPNAA